MQKYLKITQEEIRKACEISHRMQNSFFTSLLSVLQVVLFLGISHALRIFRMLCEYFACFANISHALRIFRIAMWNCWMLDFFSDSLPCILDLFGKGYEALQNLDSSCVWALTCLAMDYTKFSLILGSF